MSCTRIVLRVTAMALVLAAWLSVAAQAADDEDLRKQALALNNVTGNDAIIGEIAGLLEKPTETKKMLAVALKIAKEKDQPFNVNALYILGRTSHRLKEYDAGAIFYRANVDQALKLQSGQRMVQAFSGLIDILYESKKYEECTKVCQEVLEAQGDDTLDRFKNLVLQQMIRSLTRQGKVEDAMKMVNTLVKAQPENWLALDLKAWVLREDNKFEESAKTYEEVLESIKKDKRLKDEQKADFSIEPRYYLSGIYIDLKQIDKAAEHLKTLLAQDPDNPTFNNDLGFIWADHNMHLEEAEKMIRKAIEEDRKLRKKANVKPENDKDNAAYLDSLGWVLHKQKKHKEAKEYLQQAAKAPEGQHIEIYDHLADVLLELGEKSAAIDAWKKGLELAGTSKREQDRKAAVEKKLKANQ